MYAFVPSVVAPTPLAKASLSSALTSALTSAPSLIPAVSPPPAPHARPLADAASQRVAAGSPAGPAGLGCRAGRTLVWLDGSLRLDDNEALHKTLSRAGNSGKGNVALAVLAPRAGDAAATAAVHELSRQVAARGGHLLVLARAPNALVDACEKLRLKVVAFNRSTTRDGAELQRRVCDAVRGAGLKAEAYWGEHATEPREEWLQGGDGKKKADVTPQAVLREMAKRGAESFGAAPEKLPGAISGSASVATVPVAKGVAGVDCSTAGVRKLLAGMRRDTETLRIEAAAETCVLLKPLLDCGAVSPRTVLQRVRDVVGRVQGHTASELAFRTAMSMRVHRALGVTSARSKVAA